jgi:hypothetical protein
MTEREHLNAFLTAIDASPTALGRLVCRGWVGDYQITGRHGHVLAETVPAIWCTSPRSAGRRPNGYCRAL